MGLEEQIAKQNGVQQGQKLRQLDGAKNIRKFDMYLLLSSVNYYFLK